MTRMPDDLDVDAMITRFRERAAAVRRRGIPPVEGPERRQIIRQMQLDFQDFAMIGDAAGTLEDGILTLRLDLRGPADPATDAAAGTEAGPGASAAAESGDGDGAGDDGAGDPPAP